MFLMMQMGGGRRKRSIDEEEGFVSSTIDKGKALQYTLEVNVVTQKMILTLVIPTKRMINYF